MHSQTVFIVDDDPSVRDALGLLLSLRGYPTAMFASAEDFLAALTHRWRGVVLADIRMPGMSGLELQAALEPHRSRLPVIIITGHGDVAAARQALKAHAVDFLEKPLDDARLIQAIDQALDGSMQAAAAPSAASAPTALLSRREKEVMRLVVDGLDNKSVGEQLGISPRTVEVHKARLMAKVGAKNLAELMRIALGR